MEMLMIREKKRNEEMLPVGLFREWSLPVWYYKQIEPSSPCFCEIPVFKNRTQRNWITLRSKGSAEEYYLDRCGVLQIPGGASIELWIEEGDQYITPRHYRVANQWFREDLNGVETEIHTGSLSVGLLCYPQDCSDGVRWDVVIKEWDTRYQLRPIAVLVVYRPYGNDGWVPTGRLAYRNGKLWADQRVVLEVAEEPSVTVFSNERTGELIPLLQQGIGNMGTKSSLGWCAGALGYRGLPGQVGIVSVNIRGRSVAKRQVLVGSGKSGSGEGQTGEPVKMMTGTRWDPFFSVAEGYLDTFCPDKPESVDIYQMMVLNRYGKLERSRAYLMECLRRVRINGKLDTRYLGTDRILYAVEDYLRYGGDSRWLESFWTVLKKVAFYLMETAGEGITGFPDGWHCASLRSFGELALLFRRPDDVSAFRNGYLHLLQRFHRSAAMLAASMDIPSHFTVGDCMALPEWVYPLHLSDNHWTGHKDWLELVKESFYRQGGITSPPEYSGIDLEQTAKFCQQLVWCGNEYRDFIRLFERMAGPAWSWPDRVHPVTCSGIGTKGHDPAVLFQLMLLWRLIFIHDVGDDLYLLPGVFTSRMWERPNITVQQLPTRFGKVSICCQTVGINTRITIEAAFRRYPSRILLRLNPAYQVVYWDGPGVITGSFLEMEPDVRVIRLKKCTI